LEFPKYLFGESYGTTRAAVLSNLLETEKDVDFNGVILLSEILNFDDSADDPEFNPGVEIPYQLALPTYAATAWYHHKLPDAPKDLAPLLAEVEHFAMNDYAQALEAAPRIQPISAKRSSRNCTSTPVFRPTTSRKRICGSTWENSPRRCKTMPDSPLAGWIRAFPGLR